MHDNKGYFRDVPANLTCSPYVDKGKELGIVHGTKTNYFEPEKALTREEALVLLMQVFDVVNKDGEGVNLSIWYYIPNFEDERKASVNQSPKDMNKVSVWAQLQIKRLLELGIISGFDDGSIKPNGTLTKAEASVLLLKFFEKCAKEKI